MPGIRPATKSDASLVQALDARTFGASSFPIDYFVQGVDIFGRGYFCSTSDDAVSGYAIVCRDAEAPSRGHVMSVAVSADYRQQGIGEALTRHGLDVLRYLGCHEAELTVAPANEGAIALYSKLGFRKTDYLPSYFGDGADRNLMQIRLVEA